MMDNLKESREAKLLVMDKWQVGFEDAMGIFVGVYFNFFYLKSEDLGYIMRE